MKSKQTNEDLKTAQVITWVIIGIFMWELLPFVVAIAIGLLFGPR